MKNKEDIINVEGVNGIVSVRIFGASDSLLLSVNHGVRIDQTQSHFFNLPFSHSLRLTGLSSVQTTESTSPMLSYKYPTLKKALYIYIYIQL